MVQSVLLFEIDKMNEMCCGRIDPTQAAKDAGFNHREHRVVKPILCVPLCPLWLYPLPMSFMSIALLCIRLTTTKMNGMTAKTRTRNAMILSVKRSLPDSPSINQFAHPLNF